MGWRWWHFRVAHVGYFSHATLDGSGARRLTPVAPRRPGWVLPLSYLLERLERYLPSSGCLSRARWIASIARARST